MAESATQRSYQAPCPGCGAPVSFASAQSTHAVCSYCRSTIVRSGEVLQRVGKMAELFDDHSPLQLMASGRIQPGGKAVPFTLVGRLQYKSETGVWTEWVANLGDGSLATLGEDNGAYVFTRTIDPGRELPPASAFNVGGSFAFGGKSYSVAFRGPVQLIAAQGELPKLPALGQPFDVVELRSSSGDVLSIDYGHAPPHVEQGRAVLLEDLQLKGLKEASVKGGEGRKFSCPQCGAPVQVKLATTQSLTCGSCRSIIDVSKGIAGELRSAQQRSPIAPLIALGAVGQLQGVHWQVVGFQKREGHSPGDDERFTWSEYLLYNQKRGFCFLVDSEEGWSLVRPTTGAPELSSNGLSATYLGTKYQRKYSYDAETIYVLGEFYWPVERGQKTSNSDFESKKGLLSLERSPQEVTWSSGDTIDSAAVAKAFKLEGKKEMFRREDPGPTAGSEGGWVKTIAIFLVIMLIMSLLDECSDMTFTRSSGGSFGGYSSGGSHK